MEENGGTWRNVRKKVYRKQNDRKGRKIVENRGKWRKMEEHGGMPGKRYIGNKTTEKEGKSLKTGGKWRNMEE